MIEKTFDTGMLKINYAESDTPGAPMVLLHGLTGRWQGWNNMLSELESRWHLYAPDLRGHGRSQHAGSSYGLLDYAGDVIALLQQIDEPVVLIGHSLGAMTAIGVASQFPSGVRALVLLDPPLGTRSMNSNLDALPGFKEWFSWVRVTVKDAPSYQELAARCRAKLLPNVDELEVKRLADQLDGLAAGTVESALQNQLLAGLDLGLLLQQIQCPTLLIQGNWDQGGAISEDDLAFFKANFPSAVVVKIPDMGHLVMDEHVGIVLDQMDALLTSV